MKVAIVHDWLTGMRGGEKVLLELLRLFPDADLFTLFYKPGAVTPEIERRICGVSFLQSIPGIATRYREFLPLLPAAIRSFSFAGYERLISSSHAVAKSIAVPAGAIHVSYIHTPMRYIWEVRSDYIAFGRHRLLKRAGLSLLSPWLRYFDKRTASGVHMFVANSENVRRRLQRAYGVDSQVIYPPVDTAFFTPETPRPPRGDFYLVVSALEPYKRIDLAIRAFSGGSRPLIVVGEGTLGLELRRIAKPPVRFLGAVNNEKLRSLYRNCRALVFPGVEDFGIVPVEAQACGTPVICFAKGGALETVHDGVTGLYFAHQTSECLLQAVERTEHTHWSSSEIRENSLKFSTCTFQRKVRQLWNGLESGDPLKLELENAHKLSIGAAHP